MKRCADRVPERPECRSKVLRRMQLHFAIGRHPKCTVSSSWLRVLLPFRCRFRRRLAYADLQKRRSLGAGIVQAERRQRGRDFAGEGLQMEQIDACSRATSSTAPASRWPRLV